MYSQFGKRVFDVFTSTLLLIVASPILLIVATLVYINFRTPILFKQKRPGLDGKEFAIYKFRTMLDRTDDLGNPLPDNQRLTRFGQFLRSTSLDELPEFFNVLKGDMSLVGPRPLLTKYLAYYTPEQARRHQIKPGITGWAQVNGRNALSWEEKFSLDVWYVDNYSVWLDLKILYLTILTVFKRDNISEEGHATMSEFKG